MLMFTNCFLDFSDEIRFFLPYYTRNHFALVRKYTGADSTATSAIQLLCLRIGAIQLQRSDTGAYHLQSQYTGACQLVAPR